MPQKLLINKYCGFGSGEAMGHLVLARTRLPGLCPGILKARGYLDVQKCSKRAYSYKTRQPLKSMMSLFHKNSREQKQLFRMNVRFLVFLSRLKDIITNDWY